MFDQLDFLYCPSKDVAADARWFTGVLGAKLVFAIEGMGTRVAMVELTPGPPRVLLADHVEGETPIFVYRVVDLDAAVAQLETRGFDEGTSLEIPHGPVRSFRGPGGHRIALYELTRPDAAAHFEGRFDF